jgi:hypothetical protein
MARWSEIAVVVGARLGKQCRERWTNHLDPSVRKDGWTAEEDALLDILHDQFGNR